MTSSPAAQGAGILAARSVGTVTTGAWPIKVGRMPTTPDAAIAVYDTPGETPEVKWLLDRPGIMVMVRGAVDDYAGAYSKAVEIKDVFLGTDPIDITCGDRWDGVTMLGDLNGLGYDDNSRPLITMNFRVLLERAPSVLTNRASL